MSDIHEPTVLHGDCLEHLRALPDASVDAVVTDPPYALAFMGREWDRQPSPKAFEAWCEQWAAECLRVVKPGGYLASFGGTRTYHRLACGIEDAGWYITDAIGAGLYAWTHGQGFPKGKSQLKPAWEPITIARKPAAKVQPLGIDACRVSADWATDPTRRGWQGRKAPDDGMWGGGNIRAEHSQPHAGGRWPTNLVLAHHPECVEVGTREVKMRAHGADRGGGHSDGYRGGVARGGVGTTYGTNGRETVAAFDCHPDCHVAVLDEQSGDRPGFRGQNDLRETPSAYFGAHKAPGRREGYGDTGGASRFFPQFRYSGSEEGFYPVESVACGEGWTKDVSTSAGRSTESKSDNSLTDGSGSKSTAPSLLGTKSTTGITTHSTTTSKTSCASPRSGTTTTTSGSASSTAGSTILSSATAHGASSGSLSPSSTSDEPEPGRGTAASARRTTSESGRLDGGTSSTLAVEPDTPQGSRPSPTFRYTAKAGKRERPQVDGRSHPTVKPYALMSWLVRLVCPPDGVVLDPFAGSGTTLQAARDEGMRAVGVEADEHSVALIHKRLETPARQRGEPAAEWDLFTDEAVS